MQVSFQYTFEDFQQAAAAARAGDVRQPKVFKGLVGWLLFVALAVTLFLIMRLNNSAPAVPGLPAPPVRAPATALLEDVVWPLLPWVLIFGFVFAFVFRQMRGNLKRSWDASPGMHRPQTMIADADGFALSDTLAELRYRWDAFGSFLETPTLFLLRIENTNWHFVPKHAFASDAEMDEFRALLQRSIGTAGAAFPVVPLPPGAAER